MRGSKFPELPRDPLRDGTDPERGACPGASRPLRQPKPASGPRDEVNDYRNRGRGREEGSNRKKYFSKL